MLNCICGYKRHIIAIFVSFNIMFKQKRKVLILYCIISIAIPCDVLL